MVSYALVDIKGGNIVQTNRVWVRGEIISNLELDHEFNSMKFYNAQIKVYRLSGNYDIINLIISEALIEQKRFSFDIGLYVEVEGELRSFNVIDENDAVHLKVFIYTTEINVIGLKEHCQGFKDINCVSLEGYICRPPVYRVTPFGKQIADIMLAVNRAYGKTSYIPCIAWGQAAKYAGSLNVGDSIKLEGRFQSRKYVKKLFANMDLVEERETYEVSIQKIGRITQE